MRRFADTMQWAEGRGFAIDAAVGDRMGFIRRTYTHLLMEICLVGAVASFVIKTPFLLENFAMPMATNILFYLLGFFGVSFVSRRLLAGHKSMAIQYSGAGLWVVFLGLLVAPICYLIFAVTGSYAILGQAFVMTACVFAGLTAYVFTTKKDFSFMRGALAIVTTVVFGVSIVAAFMGGGGILFNIVWVLLLGGWVLYDTSNILHRRNVNEHVAASVDLLVDFVYMFIHIAMLLMRSND